MDLVELTSFYFVLDESTRKYIHEPIWKETPAKIRYFEASTGNIIEVIGELVTFGVIERKELEECCSPEMIDESISEGIVKPMGKQHENCNFPRRKFPFELHLANLQFEQGRLENWFVSKEEHEDVDLYDTEMENVWMLIKFKGTDDQEKLFKELKHLLKEEYTQHLKHG